MKLVKDNASEKNVGLLGKGVEVNGDIIFADQLQVEGKVTGRMISENGTLIIGETGRVDAQVEVNVCVIHGVVNGNVNAKSRVEIHKASRVSGDLATSVLVIEEGAVLNGAVGMNQQAEISRPEEIRFQDSDEKIKAKGA
jgi:cytoskeletal protein CcmA (bactofilin family)